MRKGLLPEPGNGRRWLLVIAAPAEWCAVMSGRQSELVHQEAEHWCTYEVDEQFEAVLSGVGKGNASGGTARVLDTGRHCGVVSIGVGGALPGSGLELGEVVIGTFSVYGDEGVQKDDGFEDVAQMGFGPGRDIGRDSVGIACTPALRHALSPIGDQHGSIATVSTCSGTEAAAAEIEKRTGALAEAMEGAAVGFTTKRLGGADFPFLELRVISNTTGSRDSQRWDVHRAMARLSEIAPFL